MSSLKRFVIFTPDYCESILLAVRPIGWAIVREYPNTIVYGQDIQFKKIGLSETNLKEYWKYILMNGGVMFESVQKNAYHGRYVLLPTIVGGPGFRYIWYDTDVYESDGCLVVPSRIGGKLKMERIPRAEGIVDFYIDKSFMRGRDVEVTVYGPP